LYCLRLDGLIGLFHRGAGDGTSSNEMTRYFFVCAVLVRLWLVRLFSDSPIVQRAVCEYGKKVAGARLFFGVGWMLVQLAPKTKTRFSRWGLPFPSCCFYENHFASCTSVNDCLQASGQVLEIDSAVRISRKASLSWTRVAHVSLLGDWRTALTRLNACLVQVLLENPGHFVDSLELAMHRRMRGSHAKLTDGPGMRRTLDRDDPIALAFAKVAPTVAVYGVQRDTGARSQIRNGFQDGAVRVQHINARGNAALDFGRKDTGIIVAQLFMSRCCRCV